MKRIIVAAVLLFLTACATSPMSDGMKPLLSLPNAALPDLGPAPELKNSTWLNTEAPLRIAGLRGKVVGVEMWTFDCINCQHVMPYLKDWYGRYKDQGFVLIGNHYPEFSYEADLTNLKHAISQDGILYPVAQDNDGETWDAYKTMYWPSLFLIDKRGRIRYVHIGEGDYNEIEGNIRSLLAEAYP